MNLLLVDDEIAMLHIMEKAIDWKNSAIEFPSFQIHLLQQKGCKFHKICSLFAYIRYILPNIY